jgi:hypothetical protein
MVLFALLFACLLWQVVNLLRLERTDKGPDDSAFWSPQSSIDGQLSLLKGFWIQNGTLESSSEKIPSQTLASSLLDSAHLLHTSPIEQEQVSPKPISTEHKSKFKITSAANPHHHHHHDTVNQESTFTTTTKEASPRQVNQTILPNCRDLMLSNNSLADGAFLTASPYQWTPRSDGSRQFDLTETCQLHRYTADEARQCLAGQHVNMIGDSLTRFQFLSFAYLIHHGRYPPRFGFHLKTGKCTHLDHDGQPTCSTPQNPNIIRELEFRHGDWAGFHQAIGGGASSGSGGVFRGQMECNCARDKTKCKQGLTCAVENFLYVHPGQKKKKGTSTRTEQLRTIMSYIFEFGFGTVPLPVKGHNLTNCSFTGTCRRELFPPMETARSTNWSYDWIEPLDEALVGSLRRVLPPVSISLYNRGLWGNLEIDRAKRVLPQLYNFTGGEKGRCFFKSTTSTARPGNWLKYEPAKIRPLSINAGCSFFDLGHITSELLHVWRTHHKVPNETELIAINNVWVDNGIHFQPWVYEEMNNVLLNVLCNKAPPVETPAKPVR